MPRVRVGVFVCHCGTNIGGVIRVKEVVQYARRLPLVAHAEDNLYSCSDAGLSSLREKIARHELNRVVVAACTPRTHEELFRRACEEAGVNRYLFEFVNLREHCSWIHMQEPDAATAKAQELVRLGVVKAAALRPLERTRAPVLPVALVIGGGPAGLAATGCLARQGFAVHLVEREAQLGGLASRLWKLLPGDRPAPELVQALLRGLQGHPGVTVHLESTITGVSGFVGAFHVSLETPGGPTQVEAGTIIVATGAREHEPLALHRLGELEGVLTQLQLEQALAADPSDPGVGDVVMINCAGARGPGHAYCGRLCCAVSLKNARYLRELDPGRRVTVLQRDVMASGAEFEEEYRRARQAGVRFVRYDPGRPPVVLGEHRVTGVRVHHEQLGEDFTLPAGTVVLTTPLEPQIDSPALSQLLKVPVDADGFFLEAHLKLRPVEFATDGVFVAGAARFPSDIREAVAQGTAAAAKAAAPMATGEVSVEATTATVATSRCSGCGSCELVCPFGAITLEADESGPVKARVNAVMCKGCGACVPACPGGAMQQEGFDDAQIFAMVQSLARDHVEG